ncbi:tRNA dihydrouridine(20/20a) synthase DusA [Synechocystis sp. LEGE 06083]|uniref:tRNA dihydrouridine(20/20a) synthase DusA n=1 Tax=Synechocystis sp. LEGE 06083 TaxID=915336 RepID=UPI00188163B0|nr:tRNA dihydrouridine(20/20a) synthase DusA [Synechocystis sp. LEGE 06083]MBE9195390.1 tRNA dihydrouridine(20/20a) synthase DusA [Synechocystis sp. LEGE 06083]
MTKVFSDGAVNPLSVAPMMDHTDRHFRYFLRQLTRHTLLYTEMITAQAILHGDRPKLLDFSPEEKPVALQLGGDNPQLLAECARIGQDWGYDEINLNVGCPSDRVQSGNFGACLMAQPELVAQCVAAMQRAVAIPVTVKHRIGIDDQDSYEDLVKFVTVVAQAGCQRFTVHARKAWLQGLSPKENRTIPPLRYQDVYQLKKDCPELAIEINGGITQMEQINAHLHHVDAVMVGRAAYENPYLFATVDRDIYQKTNLIPSRAEIIERMLPYVEERLRHGDRLNQITRHLLSLFNGQPRAKFWRRTLSDSRLLASAGPELLEKALKAQQSQDVLQPV